MARTSKYWTTVYVEFKSEPLKGMKLKENIVAGIMRLCNINRKIIHTEIVDMGVITSTDKFLKKSLRGKVDKKKVMEKYREESEVWKLPSKMYNRKGD